MRTFDLPPGVTHADIDAAAGPPPKVYTIPPGWTACPVTFADNDHVGCVLCDDVGAVSPLVVCYYRAFPGIPWEDASFIDPGLLIPRAALAAIDATMVGGSHRMTTIDGAIYVIATYLGADGNPLPQLVAHDPAPRIEGAYVASDSRGVPS